MDRATRPHPLRLWAEIILLFIGIPLGYWLGIRPKVILPMLWLGAGVALAVSWRDPTFDRRRFGAALSSRQQWWMIVALFVPACIAITACVYWLLPAALFNLPRERPRLWLLIATLYPLLSVYPQELIWRGLFFHRYRMLFPSRGLMVLASAAAFAWVHVIMLNPLAIAMTFAGGILFGWRYDRTRSLAAVSFEHSLYGVLVFTVGLGAFFYHATFRMLAR